MKLIIKSCFILLLFMFIPITLVSASTTTGDTIIVDIPEEMTTGDTIVITPFDYIEQLRISGKMSNEFVEHLILDLTKTENGTIESIYYSGEEQIKKIKTINISSKTMKESKNIITRFIFELSNRYRPNAHLIISNEEYGKYHIYTVFDQRVGAINNVIDGLPEAFNNEPVSRDSDNSWVDKYNPVIVDNEVKILTLEQIEEYKKSLAEMNIQIVQYITDNKYVQFFIKTVLSIF